MSRTTSTTSVLNCFSLDANWCGHTSTPLPWLWNAGKISFKGWSIPRNESTKYLRTEQAMSFKNETRHHPSQPWYLSNISSETAQISLLGIKYLLVCLPINSIVTQELDSERAICG